MKWIYVVVFFVMFAVVCSTNFAQTQKPLTNSDVVAMTNQGFEASLIIKAIQAGSTKFDVSPQALMDLKSAGVQQSVMEAMLSAGAAKPTAAVEPAHAVVPPLESGKPLCDANSGCLLRDATQVALKFASDLTSKTAHEGDPVEFVLDEDVKVADSVVVSKGAHAVAVVSIAKHAGMMGKPGELSIQLQYLIAGSNHIRLRGTKGREGESKTGATVALTVLFGPIGLIKHGKDVQIAAGTALTAYVDQDIWLPAVH
jgi:hypothetical protein